MMLSKFILSILGSLIVWLAPLSVLAIEGETTPTPAKTDARQVQVSARAERAETKQATTLEQLRTRGVREITRRIEALNKLITRLGFLKKLSTPTKSSLTTNVQAEITALNALKTKIETDTDLDTLRADVKSIVNSYRIYALYIPQIHLLASSDAILETVEKLEQLATRLEGSINEAKTRGTVVTVLEELLGDLRSSTAEAKAKANAAIALLSGLTPEGYPANKSSLQSARDTIKTAYQSLKTARTTAHTIAKGLKKERPKPSASVSAPNTVQ